MSISPCNFVAPGTGKKSILYEGLFNILGERAPLAWYLSQKFVVPTDVARDANGEPTLEAVLQQLGLGTARHVEQHLKFASRWKLKPIPGSLTTYYGSKKLAATMAQHLRDKSAELYKLLAIRYNATTGQIEIAPKPAKVIPVQEEDRVVLSAAAAAKKASLEKARDKALAAAKQPKPIQLTFIQDPSVLNKEVTRTVEVEETGEIYEQEIKVGKAQAQLKREYNILNKLTNCVK